MPKQLVQFVVTANHLLDGDVVYLGQNGWSRDLKTAQVFHDKTHAEQRLAEAEYQTDVVVGVYLAEVCQTIDGPVPTHFREDFRATGPSNYWHGKQSEVPPHV